MKTNTLSTQLLGSYEIEIHYKRPLFNSMKSIKGIDDATACFKSFIHPLRMDLKEFFLVMLLTNSNRLIGFSEVGSGTSTGVMVNLKEIFQLILKTHATAFIVCHNHPSGKLIISESDKKQTKKLQQIAKIMEVTLLDHIIITSESSLSFSGEGIL
ncbi:hypothetical protein KCTC32516_00558 [Polaribacter huanghezhanensis]|uniref:JAB domain-containing protein n=1 Tax=Polaribacter huanghezhanensis TaxID=1354726 RepID=UPI0026491775|nr:JAB domain-containing protein [Polaribacter huanghezhanensis]WKD85218.1 hypothetical protein KCTC32516_00558 [Polaribacter huanghezhanensis]